MGDCLCPGAGVGLGLGLLGEVESAGAAVGGAIEQITISQVARIDGEDAAIDGPVFVYAATGAAVRAGFQVGADVEQFATLAAAEALALALAVLRLNVPLPEEAQAQPAHFADEHSTFGRQICSGSFAE